MILLVEDNPDDEAMTVRALDKKNIRNELVAHDGARALDFLFGTDTYAGRDLGVQPDVVLLDLNLPKVDGLEVLGRVRSNPKTSLVPVVILTCSQEDEDRISSYRQALTVM